MVYTWVESVAIETTAIAIIEYSIEHHGAAIVFWRLDMESPFLDVMSCEAPNCKLLPISLLAGNR